MFPINLEIYKDIIDAIANGEYTYSDLIEARDKTKDMLDFIERKMDEE